MVNRFSGYCVQIGTRILAGQRPVSIAGIAHGVQPLTPVALRYQVEAPASLAKFGYSRASTLPWRSSSEASGNSSKEIITTGTGLRTTVPAAAARLSRPGSTSADTGEASANTSRNTSGAGLA